MKLKLIVCKPGSADWAVGWNRVEAMYGNGGRQRRSAVAASAGGRPLNGF